MFCFMFDTYFGRKYIEIVIFFRKNEATKNKNILELKSQPRTFCSITHTDLIGWLPRVELLCAVANVVKQVKVEHFHQFLKNKKFLQDLQIK